MRNPLPKLAFLFLLGCVTAACPRDDDRRVREEQHARDVQHEQDLQRERDAQHERDLHHDGPPDDHR